MFLSMHISPRLLGLPHRLVIEFKEWTYQIRKRNDCILWSSLKKSYRITSVVFTSSPLFKGRKHKSNLLKKDVSNSLKKKKACAMGDIVAVTFGKYVCTLHKIVLSTTNGILEWSVCYRYNYTIIIVNALLSRK